MASHHHVSLDESRFELSAKAKSRLFLSLVIGLVLTALGCFLTANPIGEGHHESDGMNSYASSPLKLGGAGHDGAEHHAAVATHGGDYADDKATIAEHGAAPHDEHSAPVNGEHLKADAAADHGAGEHGGGHHEFHWYQRLYANLWLDGVFFTGISVIGIFFVALMFVSQAGWSAGIVRVPMAFGYFLPISVGVLLVTFLVGGHDIFHWTHSELYDKNSPEFDPILNGKHGYLNMPFFLARTLLFTGLWFFLGTRLRGNSIKEDALSPNADSATRFSFWRKNHQTSAIFLVIFAVSSSMLAWDWDMSIEPHWYSTLFGWYTFASWFVSGLATITLTLLYLKDQGLLKHVSSSTIHNMGLMMFAFSIFWTYLWISQYLLIWYANIPEEAIYFIERVRGFNGQYSALFFVNLIVNFIFPFLFLMTRDAKRTAIFLKVVAFGLLMGHWFDFYLVVMPGTVGAHSGFGFMEFGLLLTFVSAFILVISRTLANAPIVAKNHPMLQESLHHEL